jgi:hypothetical protein
MGSLTVREQKGSLSQLPQQLYKEGASLVGRPETWPEASSPAELCVCVFVYPLPPWVAWQAPLYTRLAIIFQGPGHGGREFPTNQDQYAVRWD